MIKKWLVFSSIADIIISFYSKNDDVLKLTLIISIFFVIVLCLTLSQSAVLFFNSLDPMFCFS